MDDDGRFLCELFMKRPSASMYPQYYMVIKNPIDLKEILQKVRSETYLTMEEMVSDVELMVENACTFNEEDSQVYKVKREGEREREGEGGREREDIFLVHKVSFLYQNCFPHRMRWY